MPKPTLTDAQIKALKPGDRFYKVTVGGCPGLVLMVFPSGSKIFRLQFTFEGKSQLLTLGPYPGVSLFEARATALMRKEEIRKGITESTGIVNPMSETLKIFGGTGRVDRALVKTQGNLNDLRSIQDGMKAKSAALDFTKVFFKGDESSDPKAFDGLQKRIVGNQLLAAGSTSGGDPLTLAMLDELLDQIQGGADMLFMSKTMRRKINSLMRAAILPPLWTSFALSVRLVTPHTLSGLHTVQRATLLLTFAPLSPVVRAGKIDGLGKEYYITSGNLQYEIPYKAGKVDGIKIVYYPSGELCAEVSFKAGRSDGVEKQYHKNGKLMTERHYEDGKQEGIERRHDEDGKATGELLFKNNKAVSGKRADGQEWTKSELDQYNREMGD